MRGSVGRGAVAWRVVGASLALALTGCESGGASTTGSPGATGVSVVSTAAPASTAPAGTVAASSTSAAGRTDVPATTGAPDVAEGPSPCGQGDALPAFGAVDLATGEVRWTACSTAESFRDVLGTSSGVIVGMESKEIGGADTVGLSAADGTELWRISTAAMSPPRAELGGSDVIPIFTDLEGAPFVMGVDVRTGAERWRLEPGTSLVAVTSSLVVVGPGASGPSSPPVVVGPGASDPPSPPVGLRAVDRATGAPVWASDAPYASWAGAMGARLPAATAGGVLVVPTGEATAGVDLATGAVLWTGPELDNPSGFDGAVVGTSNDGRPTVTAIDPATGAVLWEDADVMESYGGWLALGDGALVVRSRSSPQVVALDLRSGATRWAASGIHADPQMTIGTSAILLWEGTLAVVSTSDGSTTWELTEPFGSPFMNAVATDGASVFVAINSLPWSD